MSLYFYFIEAFIFAFMLALSIGPISMLCIKKTLDLGFLHGISIGLGAAIADGLYAFIIGLGMALSLELLLGLAFYTKIIGGVFLLYVSYREITHGSSIQKLVALSDRHSKLAMQSFLLGVLNPVTLIVFMAIFTDIDSGGITFIEVMATVVGVFLGSMTWWFILCFCLIKMKRRIPDRLISFIRVLSAIVLGLFGAWFIVTSFLTP
jgi:putative LysE/RhtB family amino acid efflux pump